MVTPERHAAAMEKVVSLVSSRERSAHEVLDRLEKRGFTPQEASDAVETSLRIGLLDDKRFASAFIRGKKHAGWGTRKILSRLRQAGVADEVIESCSGEFAGPEQELASALAQLERRPTRSKDPYASLMRRLVGRGFSFETANRAVRLHLDSSAQDADGAGEGG